LDAAWPWLRLGIVRELPRRRYFSVGFCFSPARQSLPPLSSPWTADSNGIPRFEFVNISLLRWNGRAVSTTLHVATIRSWMKDPSPWISLAQIAVCSSMTSISVIFSGSGWARGAVMNRINTDLMAHVQMKTGSDDAVAFCVDADDGTHGTCPVGTSGQRYELGKRLGGEPASGLGLPSLHTSDARVCRAPAVAILRPSAAE
jgi:hypothetical protein